MYVGAKDSTGADHTPGRWMRRRSARADHAASLVAGELSYPRGHWTACRPSNASPRPRRRGSPVRSSSRRAAQEGAWTAISSGEHTLVVAPTGSGKTLAAFLWSLDRLAATPPPEDPLRPLPGPLRLPAQGAGRRRRAQPARARWPASGRPPPGSGCREPEITVGVRSGDTPADERRALRPTPAGHPDHHPRVAVPAAHQPGAGGAARRRDGDPRRGARRLPAPSAAPTWPSRWTGSTSCWSGRPSGSGCPRPCARSRRWRPFLGRRPPGDRSSQPPSVKQSGPVGRRPGRGHEPARPADR